MSIITLSRSSCSQGRIIAEKVAEKLGFECLSREILLEAAEQFNVPHVKLDKALNDGPTLLERFSHGKERYIPLIKAALLNRLSKGKIVYHGLAGHFLVQDVPQVLKIRIQADKDDRIAEKKSRENVSDAVARALLAMEDRERDSWSRHVCRMNPSDSELYDLVINLRGISVDDCVTMICNTVALEKFKMTDKALKQIDDLAFAATIKATLVTKYDKAIVTSRSGKVFIKLPDAMSGVYKTKVEIESLLSDIPGINHLNFDIKSNTLPRTAMRK
ncbi:hypothetical protein DSLASN_10270 [Desulfoluna limicola]|uniref:Histidine kinase n=1 Tax=Desulfoluna limicola TaxID=2810562 RepID=A0ABM7PDZ3_9BACT|nr:cytidylate kinase-like family protein [Desulfoluna limicola]BCS95395.1 hypothetical protein DSLASN_10270 [Desulfoluna limicola]